MVVKQYNYLHEDAMFIREDVFIREQQFENEFDELDRHSTHLVVYNIDKPIGTCRYYKSKDNSFVIGRIAVLNNYRSLGIGRMLLEEAEKNIIVAGGDEIRLSAQVRVQGFYEKMGYISEGQPYQDEYCPHIAMKKQLVRRGK